VTAASRSGRLVALEGIDGSGKSTLQRRLAKRWRSRGLIVATIREPSDVALGRLAQELGPSDPWASAMVFTLDRLLARPHLEAALRKNDVVLTDRSFFSTLAYQGSSVPRSLATRMRRMQRGVTVVPGRVVYLALSPREALRRVGGRGKARAPLERLRTLARVDRRYRRLSRGRGWIVVDASRPADEVLESVDRALSPWVVRRAGARRPGTSSTSTVSAGRGSV
jgi:dTMP kinase